ncbi:anti-sigma-F factor Fin family protein [Lederbergia citrea]|uniref:Anti-sigma-F factor Fin family protein n=1 Tax=Lederbergia citrea TaxID=2833581 RepID=A0A942Z797_9BACI|nr:anti-sigma-F factor Fin family protein [Lederbergia citrea]MBS4179729.1 anti-sigma-F factor Fin family protein [Lederbergia citrea]MBS4206422.1 anti-sigma-F factor Fin family protein [Lederbergia citrea]MBS4225042.1 anti-sigma-F factor Fin family protein [Lederbergia citrea]
MPVHYYCRHCAAKMGTIEEASINSEQLGIHKLTNEERDEMVSYSSEGDIHIQAICEDCQEAFAKNPELHQYDYLIH